MKKAGKTTRPFWYDLSQIPFGYTVEVTNRFKGLDLTECLKNYGWRFITLSAGGDQNHLQKTRKRNARRQNGCLRRPYKYQKRREGKGKEEKERYTYLNAEFQRIAWRDNQAFLCEPCKEIEENNRMGKTRDLFKKIRDTKGTFHANMGTTKDRNGMDLTEAEHIKKRW